MHTYIIYFRGFVVGSQSLLTWGFCPGSSRAPTALCRRRRFQNIGGRGGGGERFLTWRIFTWGLSGVEPCADFIVSAAAHRSILVGGGGAPPFPKSGGAAAQLAAAAGRRGSGGGRRGGPKKIRKISFYLRNFLRTFLLIENCNKIST